MSTPRRGVNSEELRELASEGRERWALAPGAGSFLKQPEQHQHCLDGYGNDEMRGSSFWGQALCYTQGEALIQWHIRRCDGRGGDDL